MKKIFIILCCMLCISAHATEMCARDDTVVIPLDATINGSAGGNSVEFLWWLKCEYGTIYGATACLSKKEVEEMGFGPLKGYNQISNSASDELIGSTGYYMNADTNPDIPDAEKSSYDRRYCFLKMTHPMSSNWVYTYDFNNSPTCKDRCIGIIATSYITGDHIMRTAIFNSIGTTPPWPLE